MNKVITFSAIKYYKGIFRKKHKGNHNLILVPTNHKFFVFNVLGLLPDNKLAVMAIITVPVESSREVIDSLNRLENYVVLEELLCSTKDAGSGVYKVAVKNKGKFIKSNITFSYEPEYSDRETPIYSVDGNLSLALDEELTPTQLKMKAKANISKLKSVIGNNIKGIK